MQRKTATGFTLVELLVTLVIAAISLTIGVPSFVSFVNKNELSSLSTDIVNTLQDARERAVSGDTSVTITQDALTLTCLYQSDGTDTSCDGVDLEGSGVTLQPASSEIVFDPSGMALSELTLTARHADISSHLFEIRVLRSGRISVQQKDI